MKVDPEYIVSLRNTKSWSQEELANASGLNLRTIQRIERQGAISLQSKKSLAAVFEIDISELDYVEAPKRRYFEYKTVILNNDVKWLSSWGRKKEQGPYSLDEAINEFASEGWRVNSMNHGNSVHGGSGQVSVLFEREIID